MKFTSKELAWISLPFLALLVVVARVYSVLPAVMQDEYIYSTQSRHVDFKSQLFPNYLFSWVYSSTSLCGEGYYSCAKNLNIIFLIAGLGFVYLIARSLLGFKHAIAVITICVLSPIGVSISFFMPESMYFALMMATIWSLFRGARNGHWIWWITAGLLLGLATLVKPHALFAFPVVVLFVFIISLRSEGGTISRSLSKATGQAAIALAVKFGLGYTFAGNAGLTLFGSSYGSTVDQFVSSSSGSEAANSTGANIQSTVSLDASSIWTTLFAVSGLQVILHLALLLLLWGTPIFLSLSVAKDTFVERRSPSELGALVTLVGGLALSYVAVVSVFEGFVTAMGDDHSHRVITRYYDFLIPLLLILGFSLDKYIAGKRWVRLTQSGLITAAAIGAMIYFPTGIDPKIADSISLMGLLYVPQVLFVIAILAIGMQIFWLSKRETGGRILGLFLIPLLIVATGISSQSALISKIGTQKAYFDIAGQTAKLPLEAVVGNKIVVIGGSKPEVVTAKFWIDKPDIQDLVLPPGSTLVMSDLAPFDYALFLGTSQVEGAGQTVVSGDKFVLVRVSQ